MDQILNKFLFLVLLFANLCFVQNTHTANKGKGSNFKSSLKKYKVKSSNKTFKNKIVKATNFFEEIKLGNRPASVHPSAPKWLRKVFQKWKNQNENHVRYRSDLVEEGLDFCTVSFAAYVYGGSDIVFCPRGVTDDMVMLGHFIHELGHVTFGSWEGRPHVDCKKGVAIGKISCDETISENPLSSAGGAYSNTIHYYYTIYQMAVNLSAYEKRVAKSNGEYYLNNYINNVKPNRFIKKIGNVWKFK